MRNLKPDFVPGDAWKVLHQHGNRDAAVAYAERVANEVAAQNDTELANYWRAIRRCIEDVPDLETKELELFPAWHIAPVRLPAGTIKQPGGHGRRIAAGQRSPREVARERVMEAVRQSEFNWKPSRLNAVFAFDSLPTAQLYKKLYFNMGLSMRFGRFADIFTAGISRPSIHWKDDLRHPRRWLAAIGVVTLFSNTTITPT